MWLNGGRKPIFTSETVFDDNNIVDILNSALSIHSENCAKMDYLIDYYLGNQPVLGKIKEVRPEINNKIVLNLAYASVRDTKGYIFGEPVTYVSRTMENLKELSILNDANEFENKSSIDDEVATYMLITGLGYRASFPEKVVAPDEQPFRYASVDPRNAFVIRSTKLGNDPVLAVIIEHKVTPTSIGKPTEELIYNVYSKTQKWVFKSNMIGTRYLSISDLDKSAVENDGIQILGTLPIEEFHFNPWRLGFFEIVLDVLDSLNLLSSDTLDDVEQKIRSKLILLGVDPTQLSEKTTDELGNEVTFGDKIKSSEVIAFTGQSGINQDAKFVTTNLDYKGVDSYRAWLESMYYYILGLPERKTRGNGGGDTGHAVELRDGWASLETVARGIELSWKGSERNSIKRVLAIMKIQGVISNLKTTDIDIKFSRNKLDSIQSKVQAGQGLANMNMYDPLDITTIMNITTDPQGMVERGKKYQDERKKEEEAMINKQNEMTNQGSNPNTLV